MIIKKIRFVFKDGSSIILSLSIALFLTAGFSACSDDSSEKTSSKIKKAVDAAMAEATYKRGISVAIFKDGDSLWTYAKGYADGAYGTKKGTKMTSNTPAFIYSITKTFVSALILTQYNKVDSELDKTVADLLSGQSYYGSLDTINKINPDATVRQLLTHTTGMPNYASNYGALIPLCNPALDPPWTPANLLNAVLTVKINEIEQDTYYFVTENVGNFQYSNTN